ncbi:E3 ubiquitin-protein ligase E3D [Chionoecetes opilio]|uniref:E3 ubiquitin-protein ligase E3D n=1 Tax=Chionoecetes opilio TaxID=41210 RepID=A0A8J5CVM8_CHIOP|nr:E3 ubiquitin-protein ligase E3D [Chionoecetes opilio]
MAQVLMEVLPNIHIGNIYITLPEISDSCRDIVVEKSEFLMQLQSGQEVCLQLPRGMCLVPDAARSVNHEGQVVTVRVQLDEKTALINTLVADLMSDSDFQSGTEGMSSIPSNIVLSAHCKLCEHQVFECVKFQKVLPLPSVDWEQASEDWFCHIQKEDGDKLKPASLQPEEDECFYTELFFLLHCNLMDYLEHAKPNAGPELKCVKCNLSLGVQIHESIKMWTHNLVWKNEEGDAVYSTDVSKIMLTLFRNIDKDNFGVNCRLVLQLSSVPKRYLYMVTMNTNQKLLISSEDLQLLHSGRNEKDNREENLECAAAKRVRESGRSEVKLQAVFGVKLLYTEKEGEDEESGEWADSLHVHLIPCSDSFYKEVKSLLEATNSCLPVNIRFVEKMKVGYIIK